MKIRALLLLMMIGYKASLHIVDLIKIFHPLSPTFPLFGIISYSLFWTVYWSFAFLLMLTLLGSGVNIKHTTEIHNYPTEKKEEKKEDKETKAIILDNNPISIAGYAEEYPENWKVICDALDKEKKEGEK